MPIADLQCQLKQRIADLLLGNLGGLPTVRSRSAGGTASAFGVGLGAGATYFLLFCGLPLLWETPTLIIWQLSLWGSFYAAFAVTTARLTSGALLAQCRDRVIPSLDAPAIEAIEARLAARFQPARIQRRAVVITLLSLLVSALVLYADVLVQRPGHPLAWRAPPDGQLAAEIGWWAIGFFLLYLTAARATDTARFYGVFAEELHTQPALLFALDPAHALVVQQTATLGRILLVFWFGIALSVSTLLWFTETLPHFVPLVVGVAGLFSLPFGTFVLLRAESHLRTAVRARTQMLLRQVEQDTEALLAQQEGLDTAGWARFRELLLLHRTATAAGEYRSVLASILSLAPVLAPLLALVSNFEKLHGSQIWQEVVRRLPWH